MLLIKAFTAAAAAVGVISAAPLEARALTTDWIVKTITIYTTVAPGIAPSPSAVNVVQSPGPGLRAQSGDHASGRRPRHSHTSSISQAPVPSDRIPSATGSPVQATSVSIPSAPGVPAQNTSVAIPSDPDSPITTSSVQESRVRAPMSTTTTDEAPITTTPVEQPTTTDEAPTTTAPVEQPVPATPETGVCPTYSPPDIDTPFSSCGTSVLDIANKWRAKYGKSAFKWSEKIAEAAKATTDHNQGGVTMEHPGLINGAMGECITPGFWQIGKIKTQGYSPFEVALFGWLCEVGSDPQLSPEQNDGKDVCAISHNEASISGDVSGGRGHHDIFLGDYNTIGIYYEDNAKGDGGWPQFAGQWTADFGV